MGKPTKPVQICLPGFEIENVAPVLEETIAIIKAKRGIRSRWEGREMVPAGSIIDDLLRSFAAGSNIPLDLPFWTLMHLASAKLCSLGASLDLGNGSLVHPDIWTIVLAPSGAGKTYTSSQVLKSLSDRVPIVASDAASAAKLFEDIALTPRGLFFSDEFFQFFRQIETAGGPMSDARGMLLKLYDGQNLSRSTKKDGTIIIENPRLSLLGLTVTDTFIDGVSAESLTDGFLQRFGICIAKPDTSRSGADYPIWTVQPQLEDAWQRAFSSVDADAVFTLSDAARQAYVDVFKEHFEKLPESFYRRVLWRTFKLALIYHVLSATGKTAVGREAMAYAIRATERSIVDSAELLLRSKGGELGRAIESAQRAYEKAFASGKAFSVRDLLRAVPRLQNSATARFVYDLIERVPAPSSVPPY